MDPTPDGVRKRTLRHLEELAEDRMPERLRIELGARILEIARRVEKVSAGEGVVAESARRWDPAILTAAEFADGLSPSELDRLLEAAPRWAAATRACLSPPSGSAPRLAA
jgi:hypothetical protein